jgi:hypothetical protein
LHLPLLGKTTASAFSEQVLWLQGKFNAVEELVSDIERLLSHLLNDSFWPERAIRSQRLNTTRNLTSYVRRT